MTDETKDPNNNQPPDPNAGANNAAPDPAVNQQESEAKTEMASENGEVYLSKADRQLDAKIEKLKSVLESHGMRVEFD